MTFKRLFSFLVNVLIMAQCIYAPFVQKAQAADQPACDGTVYLITPTADLETYVYPTIESLQPCDIVEFAPGKYEYRIRFNQQSGTADEPIILRAQYPDDRPVFDLSGDGVWTNSDSDDWVGNWPGNGGSNRAIWEFSNVAYYYISGIVFRGAHQSRNSEDASAIRIVDNVNYSIDTHDISFRNCLFEENDNGVQGGGDNILYEYCEFSNNGATDVQIANGAEGTHNMYIHGGNITIRHSHIHDPRRGQNFHMRSKNARFEYNLIENGYNYMGDIMTNSNDRAEGEAITQELTLLGNVIIEKAAPGNNSKIFSLYNDKNWALTSMRINLFYNTIIGNGNDSAVLRIYQDDNMPNQEAYFYNNIFYEVHKPFTVQDTLDPSDYHLEAKNNWWSGGYDYSVYAAYMSDSIIGTELGFNDPAKKDYTLSQVSQVKDVANNAIAGLVLPQYEYNADGFNTNKEIPRTSALSLGAYEYNELIVSPPDPPRKLRIR